MRLTDDGTHWVVRSAGGSAAHVWPKMSIHHEPMGEDFKEAERFARMIDAAEDMWNALGGLIDSIDLLPGRGGIPNSVIEAANAAWCKARE
jgi:hypothetical protein